MTNKNLTIIVIVVLIIIGFVVVTTVSTDRPLNPAFDEIASSPAVTLPADGTGSTTDSVQGINQNSPALVEVTYSDQGFSPAIVTVKPGDTVRFTNNSSGPMRVASDPHPTHTDLPGFDEITPTGAEGSWSYVFQTTGTHGFHNHLNSSHTGTVIVQ